MTIYTCPQRSPEWFQLRLGKLTGSAAADMLATIKKGEAASRRNLRVQLALERLTGAGSENGYCSPAMQWGIDHEADAIAAYEQQTGALIMPVGFVDHGELLAGCSPDGFVGDDGLIEIKCPESATHYEYLQSGVPDKYGKQILHNLWISGRQWADFVSFDPRFPEGLQLVIRRVVPTEAERASYQDAARAFLTEVAAEVASIRALSAQKAVA